MSLWHPCSSCKKPISHGQIYQVCSVSTCNRARSALVFCSVACWDSHVPVLNHRDAWCEQRRAPPEPAAAALSAGPARWSGEDASTARVDAVPEGRRRLVSTPAPEPVAAEVLIIASRLKQYIADRDDMNTSADVLDVLSDIVRAQTDAAMDRARADGRKTVKGRDFR